MRTAIASGNLARAQSELAALQKAYPGSVGVLKLTALVQLASKQRDPAHATYERVLQMAPNDFEALSAITQIDLAAGKATEAAKRIDTHMKTAQPTVQLLVPAARVPAPPGDPPGAHPLLQKPIATTT